MEEGRQVNPQRTHDTLKSDEVTQPEADDGWFLAKNTAWAPPWSCALLSELFLYILLLA